MPSSASRLATSVVSNHPAGATTPSAAVSADVDAPDRVLLDLTARQVAVLAVGAVAVYAGWQTLHRLLPAGVLMVLGVPVVAATVAAALGRRDGLPLEVWAAHAVMFRRAPRRLLPARIPPPPAWAPPHPSEPAAGLLRLPARSVTTDGVLCPTRAPTATGRRAIALVATATLNLTAHSPDEQATLVAGLAAWWNELTGPVQVVVSPRRVDLTGHALRIADTVHLTGDRALTEAGLDHADFLLDLMTDHDLLARTVTIAVTGVGPDADATARRAADTTATALTDLGAPAAVLDGSAVTAVLTAATDPYQPADPDSPRTAATDPLIGRPTTGTRGRNL